MSNTKERPLRILVIEDNPADIFLLEKTLTSLGLFYELDRHEDGERAVKALDDKNRPTPDLILLDLNLPRRDGFEVLTAIRGHPSLIGVPIAILTSSEDTKDKHRIALLGGERYIHKPPTLDEYLQKVGDAVLAMLPAIRANNNTKASSKA